MSDGLTGGVGGFDLMPDFDEVTIFGGGQSIGNDFVGTFYDSKLDRSGRTLSVGIQGFEWRDLMNKFLRMNWDTSVFASYYRSPKKLYATNFIIPIMPSSVAPVSFGADESVGALWMAHYKGQLVYSEAITFRFWGMADEFMAVRLDGELVLALDWPGPATEELIVGGLWKSTSADSRKYFMGNNQAVVGDWITLEPGMPRPMEVIMGDNGGIATFFLAVEVQGVEYERNRQGGPILPAFKTSELSHDLLDVIYNELAEDEVSLTTGPVFRDYALPGGVVADDATAVEPSSVARVLPLDKPVKDDKMRKWTLKEGRTLEAEFVNTFGGKVILKNARGKTYKILPGNLSAGDREYAELAQPPALNINFTKKFSQKTFVGGFYNVDSWERAPESRGFYGLQIKQTSPGEYSHELQVEMFVVGKQRSRADAGYILLDHQKTAFIPSGEDQRTYEFRSEREVVLNHYSISYYATNHGEKYAGFLVTVMDARGEMIAVKSSSKWLIENLENLKNISVGNYMDKTCIRTFPSRPKSTHY